MPQCTHRGCTRIINTSAPVFFCWEHGTKALESRYSADSAFRAGYDANCLGEPLDPSKPAAWREGWEQAKADSYRGN